MYSAPETDHETNQPSWALGHWTETCVHVRTRRDAHAPSIYHSCACRLFFARPLHRRGIPLLPRREGASRLAVGRWVTNAKRNGRTTEERRTSAADEARRNAGSFCRRPCTHETAFCLRLSPLRFILRAWWNDANASSSSARFTTSLLDKFLRDYLRNSCTYVLVSSWTFCLVLFSWSVRPKWIGEFIISYF